MVTGAAGFIGFHIARRLLAEGRDVVGLDNLNDYYDPALKQARLDILRADPRFDFVQADLADRPGSRSCLQNTGLRRWSIWQPRPACAIRSTIPMPMSTPTSKASSMCWKDAVTIRCRHLVYASSSSVYGANTKLPFSVGDKTDSPISFYAATKKANELMAYSYSHLYRLPVTGLRFFTIYGPGAGPTWRFSCSPRRSSRAGRSSFLTMAGCAGISPISTTPAV